jgi:cell fate regulator YaaT (PSP1 superfamily)
MGCAGCAVGNRSSSKSGGCSSGGCGSSGGCSTGGCNRVNTFDWLNDVILPEHDAFDLVEITFKNGARKAFYHRANHIHANVGEAVILETEGGYDVGHISLVGELVKLQLKKRNAKANAVYQNIIRKANERDLEKLTDIRTAERGIMVQARVIARSLNLDMKIGDVEFQGDGRKATFYYTADGRVDFRELIRQYAKDFKVKVEMRQIGARQEAARVGGLGSCGRELCCSTWLSDFKNVNTNAARYQNLAINQSKLSGQCGRLKCCLNFELDAYMEAFDTFPKHAERLPTSKGMFFLLKTDIFKGLMFYSCRQQRGPALHRVLTTAQVHILQARLAAGESLFDLLSEQDIENRTSTRRANISHGNNTNSGSNSTDDDEEEDEESDYTGDVDNVVELPNDKKRKRKKKPGDTRPAAKRTDAPKADPNREVKPARAYIERPKKENNRPPRDAAANTPPRDGNALPRTGDKKPPFKRDGKDNNRNRPPRDGGNTPPKSDAPPA